ncbi:hypothetical protein FK513_31430, partial [Klebsiella pneumoniae]|uniref:hypothetical protein n=1 Tax=Klebsiella pneumoniae TaxID=573 RepID=UPI00210D607A
HIGRSPSLFVNAATWGLLFTGVNGGGGIALSGTPVSTLPSAQNSILGSADEMPVMYQAAHYELVASALAVKAAREINPALQIGCMIAMCCAKGR